MLAVLHRVSGGLEEAGRPDAVLQWDTSRHVGSEVISMVLRRMCVMSS